MANTDYLPSRESELVTWSANFSTLINADSALYGLTDPQANAYETLQVAFAAAYTAAINPGTRTPSAIVTKDDAKEAMIANTRELVRIIQASPVVTDTLRSDLGITIRDADPTPIPVPTAWPGIDFVSVYSRTVRIRLHDTVNTENRGKPSGVAGATVFSYVGETAPADIADWKFEGNTTRTSVEVDFDAEVPSGATVWLTAFWYNPRAESGPAAPPISTNIPGGLSMAA